MTGGLVQRFGMPFKFQGSEVRFLSKCVFSTRAYKVAYGAYATYLGLLPSPSSSRWSQSRTPDVMEWYPWHHHSNPDVSVRVGGAHHHHHSDVTSNPDVTSSTVLSFSWRRAVVNPLYQLDDGICHCVIIVRV